MLDFREPNRLRLIDNLLFGCGDSSHQRRRRYLLQRRCEQAFSNPLKRGPLRRIHGRRWLLDKLFESLNGARMVVDDDVRLPLAYDDGAIAVVVELKSFRKYR